MLVFCVVNITETMWPINENEVLFRCNNRLQLAKDKVTKIKNDYKSVLSSISMVDHTNELTTKDDFHKTKAQKYDAVIDITKQNITYGIECLEEVEQKMRRKKATSFLFEGGEICKEIVFCFHNKDNGRKGVCVRVGGVYATAFVFGEDLLYMDHSYPLVAASPITFLTGIELASDHDPDLIIKHVNYAIVEPTSKIKVYQDSIAAINQLFEANAMTDRLSKMGVNDLKEQSNVFDVQVFGTTLSITIDSCVAMNESRSLPYCTSSNDNFNTDEESMFREILIETTPRLRRVPLAIGHASSNSVATNPLLEGMADCIKDDRNAAIINLESDMQDSFIRIFASLKPKKLNRYNVLLKLIDDNFTNKLDVVVSKQLLEKEEYASRVSLAITKDVLGSLKFLGGLGLDTSVLEQRQAIEGMRSERGYYGEEMRHCTPDCLKTEELAEKIKDWICTQYRPSLFQSDSKVMKAKNISSNIQWYNKRIRPSSGKSRKRSKNESVLSSNVEERVEDREEKEMDATKGIRMKQVATVIPPVMFDEPREASSDKFMKEIIREYAHIIAKHVAGNPNGNVRLSLATRLYLLLGEHLVTPSSNIITLIKPVEFSLCSKSSVCEALFSKSGNTEDASMIEVKHDLKKEEILNRMKSLLNLRRCHEEQAAYMHLMNISTLEKMVGIVSGEGIIYSTPLRNAVEWYFRIVIRNRVADVVETLSPENNEFIPKLVLRVISSLDWFLKFDINHKYLSNNTPSASPKSLYSATRYAALISVEPEEEDTFPVMATRMPPMTSMIRRVRIGDSFSLTINNYSTGNLFMFSTKGMKTRHREFKEEFHNDLYSAYFPVHTTNKSSFARVMQPKKTAGNAEEILKNGSAPMTIFVCNYKKTWRNLCLFDPPSCITYRFVANNNAKIMLSLNEQYILNSTLEGKSLFGYQKAVEKYIISPFTEKAKSLTKIDLVVLSTINGEELYRCEGMNDCMFLYNNNTIKSVMDLYVVKTTRREKKMKRAISSGKKEDVNVKDYQKKINGMLPLLISKINNIIRNNQNIKEECISKRSELK